MSNDMFPQGYLDYEAKMNAAEKRKATPIYSGVVAYFPDALAAVARVSKAGNDQHNPGTPLHWDRSKSSDEYDACQRHLVDRAAGDEYDTDGQRHMAKAAWRALAALQKEVEGSRNKSPSLIIEYGDGETLEVRSVPGKVVENSNKVELHRPDPDYYCKYCGIKGSYGPGCAPCIGIKIENSKSQKIAPTYPTRKDCTGDPPCLTDGGRQAKWRDDIISESARQAEVARRRKQEAIAGYIESLQECGEEDCK